MFHQLMTLTRGILARSVGDIDKLPPRSSVSVLELCIVCLHPVTGVRLTDGGERKGN